MVVVRHQRDVLAGLDQLREQADQVVGVLRTEEAVRPEGQRLGADADGLDVVELGLQQRLEVVAQVARLHHHRVAAGDQQVGDFGVLAQVVVQHARLGRGDAQLLVADELRPAEAEGAVAVAGLALAGEEQHRLAVLVLHAVEPVAVLVARHVHLHLIGRVRVERVTDRIDRLLELTLGRLAADQLGDALVVLGREHAALREGELEDRIGGHVRPVDQLVDHVLIDAEGQHRRHHLHLEALRRRKLGELRDAVEVALGVDLERHRSEQGGAFLRGLHSGVDGLESMHLSAHETSSWSVFVSAGTAPVRRPRRRDRMLRWQHG